LPFVYSFVLRQYNVTLERYRKRISKKLNINSCSFDFKYYIARVYMFLDTLTVKLGGGKVAIIETQVVKVKEF